MKKILTTAVFAMALALVANAYDKTVSTFEDGAAEAAGNFYFLEAPTTITASPNYTSYKGVLPSETSSGKYLAVSTDGELLRQANALGTSEVVTNNFYIDMMAKFNETEAAKIGEEDKLAIFMNASGKLVVVAGVETNECETTTTLTADTWYRVMIRMIEDISTAAGSQPGFVVSINGTNVAAGAGSYLTLSSLNETAQSYYSKRELFPTITGGATIKGLALTGVGSVDDIVFRSEKAMDTDIINPYDGKNFSDVTYTIVDASGEPVKVDDVDATPRTVDYSALPTGVYSVKASAEGEESTTVGTAVGVIKIADTATDVLIAVPWKTADGDDPTIADIVDPSSLSNGDTLSVYSADEQQFVSFTYNNGAWARTVDTVETTMDVNTVIAPGSAAYLHRTDTTTPICLIGKVASVGDATPEAGTASEAKWSAFGSTVAVNKSIDDVITGEPERATKNSITKAKDMISVPKEDGTFVQYFCGTDGKWYTMTYQDGKPTLSEAPEGVLKAGRGFMYRSKGGTPSISFSNN